MNQIALYRDTSREDYQIAIDQMDYKEIYEFDKDLLGLQESFQDKLSLFPNCYLFNLPRR